MTGDPSSLFLAFFSHSGKKNLQQSAAHKPLHVCVCSIVSGSFVTPETEARQAPLSMGFSRQEYWSGLLFPSPRYLSEKSRNPHVLCLLHWWQILYHWATWEAHELLSSLKWAVSVDSLTPVAFSSFPVMAECPHGFINYLYLPWTLITFR